jgi:chromosome segregation ATPase
MGEPELPGISAEVQPATGDGTSDGTVDYEQWILELEKLIAEQQEEITKLKKRPLRGKAAKQEIAAHKSELDRQYAGFNTEAIGRIRDLEEQVKEQTERYIKLSATPRVYAADIAELEDEIYRLEDENDELERTVERHARYIEALESGGADA